MAILSLLAQAIQSDWEDLFADTKIAALYPSFESRESKASFGQDHAAMGGQLLDSAAHPAAFAPPAPSDRPPAAPPSPVSLPPRSPGYRPGSPLAAASPSASPVDGPRPALRAVMCHPDASGRTPLWSAAARDHNAVCTLLLSMVRADVAGVAQHAERTTWLPLALLHSRHACWACWACWASEGLFSGLKQQETPRATPALTPSCPRHLQGADPMAVDTKLGYTALHAASQASSVGVTLIVSLWIHFGPTEYN